MNVASKYPIIQFFVKEKRLFVKNEAKSINHKERKVKNTQRAQREFFAPFAPSL
jgi:hypothetical protein